MGGFFVIKEFLKISDSFKTTPFSAMMLCEENTRSCVDSPSPALLYKYADHNFLEVNLTKSNLNFSLPTTSLEADKLQITVAPFKA